MRPRSCATRRASAISVASRRASRSERRPRSSRALRVWPVTYSIAINGWPSSTNPTSWYLADEWVVEAGRGLGFLVEPAAGGVVAGACSDQELQRDLAIEGLVMREGDLTHAPVTESGQHAIASDLPADHTAVPA